MNLQPIDFDYFRTSYFIYTTLAVIVGCFVSIFFGSDIEKDGQDELEIKGDK